MTGSAVSARELTEVVNQLRRALRASIRSDYPWESLPLAQVELLQALDEAVAPVRVGELAVRLSLATNTVSTLIRDMSRGGLVTRRHDEVDARAVYVSVTDSGRELLAQWQRAHEDRLGSALSRLSARDRQRVLTAVPALGALVLELRAADAASASQPTAASR